MLLDNLDSLQAMGLTLPTPAYLIGAIVFGIIGYAAYRRGKTALNKTTKWLGVGLMLYPYLVSDTWLLYVLGVGLCLAVYLTRR